MQNVVEQRPSFESLTPGSVAQKVPVPISTTLRALGTKCFSLAQPESRNTSAVTHADISHSSAPSRFYNAKPTSTISKTRVEIEGPPKMGFDVSG